MGGISGMSRETEHYTVKSKDMDNYDFLFIISASLAWTFMCFEYDWPICNCVGIGFGHHSSVTSHSYTITSEDVGEESPGRYKRGGVLQY